MSNRTRIDIAAGIAAVVVAFTGGALILNDPDLSGPETTTTVTREAVERSPGTTKRTTVVTRRGGETTRQTTTEVVGPSPAKPAETTKTTEEGQRTFPERVLGDGGMVVLQIAAVLLAAFLAGAMLQRVLLGHYGGFKLGSFELTAVERASTQLEEAVRKLSEEAARSEDVKRVQEESRREDAAVNRDLVSLMKRIELLERRLEPGGRRLD